MSVKISSVTITSGTQVAVQFTYTPGDGQPATPDSTIFGFGPANTFDPAGSVLGYPNGARVSSDGDNNFSVSFNPNTADGDSFHFAAAAICAGVVDATGDQVGTVPAAPSTLIGPPPTVTLPTASSDPVMVTWTTAQPGLGMVVYQADGGTANQASEDASTTNHSVALDDLVGATHYTCHYETDLDDSDVTVVSNDFTFTTAAPAAVDPPGHVAVCAVPMRIKVGGTSTVTVQVVGKDGKPLAGVPVAFSLGAGQADGTLSSAGSPTDAKGHATTVLTIKDIPAGRRKARRAVVVLAGTAPKQKRRRAVVIALAK